MELLSSRHVTDHGKPTETTDVQVSLQIHDSRGRRTLNWYEKSICDTELGGGLKSFFYVHPPKSREDKPNPF